MQFLVLCVAGFTSFRIFGIPALSEILLSFNRENELLTTLGTDQHPGLKAFGHKSSPCLKGLNQRPCGYFGVKASFLGQFSMAEISTSVKLKLFRVLVRIARRVGPAKIYPADYAGYVLQVDRAVAGEIRRPHRI